MGVSDGKMKVTFPDGAKSNFTPVQFHFHSPSENTINGKNYDLEMHIVHQYADGGFGGVLAFFFDTTRCSNGNPSLPNPC